MLLEEKFMRKCLLLAEKGLGHVAPNPLVGAVIVYNNQIIGEGFHQQFGQAHAEINAINNVKDKSLLINSTLYVNLEPCAHFGKTPPCVNAIIEHKIPRVVISNQDPFPLVNSNGIQALQNAGVEVTTNVLKDEGAFLNRRFFTNQLLKRPYIILKWAQSKNKMLGKIGQRTKITNEAATKLNFTWRTQEDAIMVGSNTVVVDNPLLNVRTIEGKNPIRIIIDSSNVLLDGFQVLNGASRTIVFTSSSSFKNKNCETILLPTENREEFILDQLLHLGISSIIVEGGKFTHNSFYSKSLWDEIRIFENDTTIENGVEALSINEKIFSKTKLDNNHLYIYHNNQ